MRNFTLITLAFIISFSCAFAQKKVKTTIETHDGKLIVPDENPSNSVNFEDEILLQKNHSQKSVKQKPAILKTSADLISQEKVKTLENEFEVLTELKKSKIDKLKSTLPIKSDGSYVTEADSLVLVTLYNSTNGSSWTDNTNWLTGPVNSWYGITVNAGQVTSINIQSNNLAGSIPSELGTLTSLQILNFHNNSLTGSIPSELGNLTNLTELALWVNQLSGSIPPELGNLTNIYYFDLDDNQLTGSIPPELGNLSNLNNIWFGNNLLTGSIPVELGNLTSLQQLGIYNTQISGSIPAELGNLSNLKYLNLTGNQLSGSIPAELGNLSNLQYLSLDQNQLTGSIPAELGNLSNLQYLILNNNQLTGSIPAELGSLTNLYYLYLNNNQLTGTIPTELGSLTNLYFLALYSNQLTGSIPAELGSLTNLQYLYLHNNQLTGSIPAELGSLTNLYYLYLYNNQLTGSIPATLGSLTNLYVLYLSSNQLTGSIPAELGSLTNLYYLSLYSNQLTGSIPAALGSLTNLQYLYLYNNQLTGDVPLEIGSITSLISLSISNNLFTGLPNLTSTALQNLYLDNNSFTFGDLENTGLDFSTLSDKVYAPQAFLAAPDEVDNGNSTTTLSVTTDGTGNTYQWYKNEELLVGETVNTITVNNTEECFYYCTVSNPTYPDLVLKTEYATFNMTLNHGIVEEEYNALIALYNSTNGDNWNNNTNWLTDKYVDEWYGVTTVAGHVTEIILANNNLTGSIPAELGSLTNLLYLYLYNNQLTGSIPAELGNLANLYYFVLFNNQLTGSIPAELGSLTNLQYLNLRSNQLTGSIPAELGSLTNLLYLYLYTNQLTGSIPAELGSLTNLQQLRVHQNQLTGSIPTELGNLTNLLNLELWANKLSGNIPIQLGNLILLTNLDIGINQLTGTIPSELGNLTNLNNLWLNNMQLNGEIPATLGDLTNLQGLYLTSNNLTGSIPTELGGLTNLQNLHLENNQLNGSIPAELGSLTNLSSLILNNNKFTGCPDLSALTNLYQIRLEYNELTFGDLENTHIDFNNPYYGYSPQAQLPEPTQTPSGGNIIISFTTDGAGNTYQWYKDGLEMAGETTNTLAIANTESGIFYCEIYNSNFPSLTLTTKALFINSTGANGVSQEEYDALVAFYNSTNGDNWNNNTNWLSAEDVSEWVGVTVEGGHVRELALETNNLTGILPSEIDGLVYIERLNIYSNGVSGVIPSEIGNLTNLVYLNFNINELEGTIPVEIGNLTNLTSLYLSDNKLTGAVPNTIGNLTNLTALSLGKNKLNALPDLSAITNIEYLYLYNNYFTFEDFENTQLDFSTLSYVGYWPQANLEMINPVVYVSEGSNYTISCDNITNETLSSTINQYAIYKDGVLLNNWSTNPDFTITSFNSSNVGEYIFKVKNSTYPNLTLQSDTLTLGINNAPSNISLSNTSVNENVSVGYIVGQLSTTDADSEDSFTYTFVSGNGTNDADNASFTIDGNNLKTNTSLDYETKPIYYIYMQTEDAAGLTYSKAFTISVVNINEAPTNISLTTSTINENSTLGSIVGQLSTTDPDASDSHTYTLATGNGTNDADNGSFTIDGNNLKTNTSLDYETKPEYYIYIRTEDAAGLTYLKAFTISVVNINESPTNIALTTSTINENSVLGSIVGQLSSTDPDASDSHTYTLATGNGTNDADNGSFTIDGNNLKTNTSLDYETKPEYHIYIQTEDAAGLTYSKAFVISIIDITETGINDLNNNQVFLYPNPAVDKVTIEYNTTDYRVKIIDAGGNVVYNTISKTNKHNIDINHIVSGIYFIIIEDGTINLTKKLIVQ